MAAISGGLEKIWNKKQFLLHPPLQHKLWLVPKPLNNSLRSSLSLNVFFRPPLFWNVTTAEWSARGLSRWVIEYFVPRSESFAFRRSSAEGQRKSPRALHSAVVMFQNNGGRKQKRVINLGPGTRGDIGEWKSDVSGHRDVTFKPAREF